jgi:hypothetical protein
MMRAMKILLRILIVLVLLVAVGALALWGLSSGWFGSPEHAGQITEERRPAAAVARGAERQRTAARQLGVPAPKQILFGDFHVHTTFSTDAFLLSLPMVAGTGSHPPADACDFARYCSQLDFWSINDHAEGLTKRLWDETVDSIRQCNAVAGPPSNPDLVSFLGWEWSNVALTPEQHYGHKNVVLLGLEEDQVPTRPIGSRSPFTSRFVDRRIVTALALTNGERGRDLAYRAAEVNAAPLCPDGVPVRDLPPDCLEQTGNPADLFAKLRDWNVPALVIPHGTTWGMYTPPGNTWAKQIAGSDPELEGLIEIYSGHGNSEEYRDWRAAVRGPDGGASCPPPSDGYLPSCWRAGELIRERCLAEGADEAECETRAGEARQNYVDAGMAGWRTVPGASAEDWLDAGQCRDCFLPAFNYRPGGSAQYILARRSFAGGAPKGLRLGFIASSDNHTARGGNGYKELGRGRMSEGMGRRPDAGRPDWLMRPEEPVSHSVPLDLETTKLRGFQIFETLRVSGFLASGGLVAVHSEGRSRQAIWDALQRKETYGTSGPRILLWFDLLEDGGGRRPMGSAATRSGTPRFRVRALGSFEQKPGCPDYSVRALGPERLERLCLGECYHPSDARRPITRIEVVRIRPQARDDEPIGALVDDPWRTIPCKPDPAGCTAEFEDPDFAAEGRDSIYYVRAIEAPSLAIHGDPLRCTTDAEGRCLDVQLCNADTDWRDDCLGYTEERAWSSPIYVDHAAR